MKNVFKILKQQKNLNFSKYAKYSTLETIQTKVDKNCPIFTVEYHLTQENYQYNKNQENLLNYHIMKILECGGKTTNEKHLSRGKLLVRDRIDKILDPG
jgi:hypothetical protein